MNIVTELRNKKSRDNRELLDRAADEIERLRGELAAHKTNDNSHSCSTKSVALLKADGSFKILYEFVETIEECELLAQLAMSRKWSQDDLVIIFPGTNRGIARYEKDTYEKALLLEKKYTERADEADNTLEWDENK